MGNPAQKLTLEELEALEDAADIAAGQAALEEMARTGEQPRPWEEVWAELGLDDE